MGLSSNILWHQTTKVGFYGILNSKKLKYSYSKESIFSKSGNVQLAFPMISLCDLPFSELEFFLNCDVCYGGGNFKSYGGYLIGFSRGWAHSQGFAPVWYCAVDSESLNVVIQSLGAVSDNFADICCNNTLAYYLLGCIKNFEGANPKCYATTYRFMDEREWRKLADPQDNQASHVMSFDDYDQYKQQHGNSLLDAGIKFTYSDIRYIVVPNNEEREKFISQFGDKLNSVKVYTRQEVNEDIIGIRHHKVSQDATSAIIEGKVKGANLNDTSNPVSSKSVLTDDIENVAEEIKIDDSHINNDIPIENSDNGQSKDAVKIMNQISNQIAQIQRPFDSVSEPFLNIKKTLDSLRPSWVDELLKNQQKIQSRFNMDNTNLE